MESSKPLPTPDEQYYAAHGPLEAALVRAVTAAAEARPASPIRFIAESLTNPERAAPTPRDDTKQFAEHAHAVESALAAAIKAAFMTRPEDPLAFVAGRLLGTSPEVRRKIADAQAIAARDDFRELTALGSGCTIELTEHRAISLTQLTAVIAHIERRCDREGWATWKDEPLTPETVSLYDADKYFIRPFTVARECAFVEMVAIADQPPLWFVSHWW